MPNYTVTELTDTSASLEISSRKYPRRWRVVSDETIDHPAIAIPQVPVTLGSIFPYDPDAFVKSMSAKYQDADGSRQVVIVTASYETGTGGQEEEENPLDEEPRITWGSRTVRLPVKYAESKSKISNGVENVINANRCLVANSADQPFDNTPEEDFHILTYNYGINTAIYNQSVAAGFLGAINQDTFVLAGLTLKPYQARIQQYSATNGERNGVRYWDQQIVVEIADDWRLILVDEGRLKLGDPDGGPGDEFYVGNATSVIVPIVDDNGEPIQDVIPLNGAGQPLDQPDPVLLAFQTRAKPLKTFGTLGLPTTNNP